MPRGADVGLPCIEPGSVISDRYRLLRPLGEGGMGSVYLVQHVKTDERFAMKLLGPSVVASSAARERFQREARTPARIDSDHVARVVDAGIAAELEGVPYIVMEYLRGRDLADVTLQVGPLAPAETVVYLRQVAGTLDKAHALGIVHRDLKPENLFLTFREDGSPCIKVLDFGIAKLSGTTGDLARVKATGTGEVFGTPMYMSPEQCLSEAEKISPQTDIWALGMIAYRLLAGDDFWTANVITHLIAQIAFQPIPKPSERGLDLGAAFDAWFARCCARQASDRFATAGQAVRELATALDVNEALQTGRTVALRAAEVARASLLDLGALATVKLSPPSPPAPGEKEAEPAVPLADKRARSQPTLEPFAGLSPRPYRGLVPVAAGVVLGAALVLVLWLLGGGGGAGPGDATGTASPGRPAATALPRPSAAPGAAASPTGLADAAVPSAAASGTSSPASRPAAAPAPRAGRPPPAGATAPPATAAPATPRPAATDPLGSRH